MNTKDFVTSDTHWCHRNIIRYSKRPFRDVDHMDEELIRRWNAKVPPEATVYHLGDFGANKRIQRLLTILRRLNGKIRWFLGNHDRWLLNPPPHQREIKDQYKEVLDHVEWFMPYAFHESGAPNGKIITMCHYGLDVWNKSHHNSWHLHGHSHGSLLPGKRLRMDVGVDCHPNYEPFSFFEIQDRMKKLENDPRDHHGRD